MSQTMYEITEQFRALANMDGTDEDMAQAIKDTWESVELAFEVKAENYAKIITCVKAEAEGIATETKRLAERKKALDNKAQSMKDTLYNAMQAAGKAKFSTPLFSFNIQKSPASVIVDDEKAIPDSFKAYELTINKTALKDALKAGKVDGAHLEQGESLRIK